jgi:hypothetical protein
MTDEQARRYAWAQLCGKLGADQWTVGEKCKLETFFIYGWAARTAWDAHRAEENTAPAAGEGG